MKFRCLNSVFGYCSGEPEVEGELTERKSMAGAIAGEAYLAGGKCKLNPETCGKFTGAIQPVEIKGEGYRHTVVAKSKTPQPAKEPNSKGTASQEKLI